MNNHIFIGVIEVNHGNPNINPESEGQPRVEMSTGKGYITLDCIARKIIDQLEIMGYPIIKHNNFTVAEDDEKAHRAVKERLKEKYDFVGEEYKETIKKILDDNIDIRLFGITAPAKKKEENNRGNTGNDGTDESGQNENKKKQTSPDKDYKDVIVRRTVSIGDAVTINPVVINQNYLSRTFSLIDDSSVRGKDTFGMKRAFVEHGVYVFTGGFTAKRAKETRMREEDILILQKAMLRMFEDDYSVARPLGSIYLSNLLWLEYAPEEVPENFSKKAFGSVSVEDDGKEARVVINDSGFEWVDLCAE